MRTPEQIAGIIAALEAEYPDALCSLQYDKDYELLFAVRLSAQCTDERVNMVTPALYARFPTLESFAEADVAEVERYGGKVPGTMEELLTLPGVGRKTANLILGDVFRVPGSTVVDTHCIRLSNRLGLVDGMKEPEKIEQALRKLLPPEKSSDFCHRVVLHGRAVCDARKPRCEACCCAPWCKTFLGD